MTKQVILENEYASLWYYPETKIVHHQMHQYVHGEHFRLLLTKGLEIFRQYGACKWLSDDRKNTQLSPENEAWSEQNWIPQILEAGWKYWAILLPKGISGQMEMQKKGIERHIGNGVQVRIFEDPESALAWLESVR